MMTTFVPAAEEGDEGYSESPYVTQTAITPTSGAVAGQDAQQWLSTMSVADREGKSIHTPFVVQQSCYYDTHQPCTCI